MVASCIPLIALLLYESNILTRICTFLTPVAHTCARLADPPRLATTPLMDSFSETSVNRPASQNLGFENWPLTHNRMGLMPRTCRGLSSSAEMQMRGCSGGLWGNSNLLFLVSPQSGRSSVQSSVQSFHHITLAVKSHARPKQVGPAVTASAARKKNGVISQG